MVDSGNVEHGAGSGQQRQQRQAEDGLHAGRACKLSWWVLDVVICSKERREGDGRMEEGGRRLEGGEEVRWLSISR